MQSSALVDRERIDLRHHGGGGMSASPGGREVGCREWGQVWPVTRETVVSFLYKLHYSVGPPILYFDARDGRLLGERLPWQGTFELNRARSGRGRKASEAQTLTAWLGSIGPGRELRHHSRRDNIKSQISSLVQTLLTPKASSSK